MTSKLTVRIGGQPTATVKDYTSQVPYWGLDTQGNPQPIITLGQRCKDKEASQGDFWIDDDANLIPASDLSNNLPAGDVVTWTEDAPGCAYWLARERIVSVETGRHWLMNGVAVGHKITVEDSAADTNLLTLTAPFVRPEETDVARVKATVETFLQGDPRLSTYVLEHFIVDANTVTMPAKTYPVQTNVFDILQDCADTAGKLWYLCYHHAGGVPVLTSWEHITYEHYGSSIPPWTSETQWAHPGIAGPYAGAESTVIYSPGNGALGTNDYHGVTHDGGTGPGWSPGQSGHVALYLQNLFSPPQPKSILLRFLDTFQAQIGSAVEVYNNPAGPSALGAWGLVEFDIPAAPAGTAFVIWSGYTGEHGGGVQATFLADEITVTATVPTDSCSHLCMWYSQETDHSTYPCTIKITDDPTLIAPNASPPVIAPQWLTNLGNQGDGQDQITGLVTKWGTSETPIFVHDDTMLAAYDWRVDSYMDSDSVNATQAAARASAILAYRKAGHVTDSPSLLLKASQTNLITAGMSVQIKAAVVNTGQYLGSWGTMRIGQIQWTPIAPQDDSGESWYRADLQLGRAIRNLPASHGKAQAAATTPKAAKDISYSPPAGSSSGSTSVQQQLDVLEQAPTVKFLTNKSGASVAAGDVVILDTANDDAFTTTTTAGVTKIIGIAQATIANNAVGPVAVEGYVALVNTTGSVTRGDYGSTSTTAKKATNSSSRSAGAFCQFGKGGTTPDAILFGVPDSATGGGSPGGAAGGDLSGTYPNPTVAKINGVAVTGTPSSGQEIVATGATAATWQTPAGPTAAQVRDAGRWEVVVDSDGSAVLDGASPPNWTYDWTTT